jgi:hypothetical protein
VRRAGKLFSSRVAFPGEVAISGGILPEKALQIKPYFTEGADGFEGDFRKRKV